MSTQRWTDEQLQQQLDAWDAVYRSAGTLDILLTVKPLLPFRIQTFLVFDTSAVELAESQVARVYEWFREHLTEGQQRGDKL